MVDYGKTIVKNSKVRNKTIEMTKEQFAHFNKFLDELRRKREEFLKSDKANDDSEYWKLRGEIEKKYAGKFPIDRMTLMHLPQYALDEIRRNVKVVNQLSSDVIKRDIESFKKWLSRIDETINFVGKIKDGRDYMKLYSRKYEDIASPMKSMIEPYWENPDSVKKFRDNMIKDLKLFRHSKELLLKELEADLKEALNREK